MKRKRNIIAVSAVAVLALIGATFAYNSSTGFLTNVFKLGVWQTEMVETFDAPSNWQPCDEVPKTVIGENTGSISAAVRVKYEEYWKLANSASTDHTSELPLVDDENDPIAVVNLDNVNDWILGNDGWYYYKYMLKPNQKTSSFMKSVTLNCKANFAGDNTCVEAEGKVTCTKPENPYDGAKYHVYATIQLISDPSSWPVTPEDKVRLYDVVARQSKGSDLWHSFDYYNYDYNDVFTADFSKDYQYPVHYYQGNVSNNYLTAGGYCWLIVRTTETGGTKVMYAGPLTDGKCMTDRNNMKQSFIRYGNFPSYYSEEYYYHDVYNEYLVPTDYRSGYMYGMKYKEKNYGYSENITIGTNAVWNESLKMYALENTSTGNYNSFYNKRNNKYLFITDPSGRKKVDYIDKWSGSVAYYYTLENGQSIDDYKAAHENENTYSSHAKEIVDSWFEENMKKKYLDKLEDTIYCNDRSSNSSAAYTRWQSSGTFPDGSYKYRLPSLDCASKNDSFTVNETNKGNGKLKYPVGLLTVDELTYISPSKYAQSSFTGMGSWTMTPSRPGGQFYWYSSISTYGHDSTSKDSNGINSGTRCGLRPVMSFKYDTYVSGGMGTYDKPYTLSW